MTTILEMFAILIYILFSPFMGKITTVVESAIFPSQNRR